MTACAAGTAVAPIEDPVRTFESQVSGTVAPPEQVELAIQGRRLE